MCKGAVLCEIKFPSLGFFFTFLESLLLMKDNFSRKISHGYGLNSYRKTPIIFGVDFIKKKPPSLYKVDTYSFGSIRACHKASSDSTNQKKINDHDFS